MAPTTTPKKLPAISLQQPWANLACCAFKDVEFRTKPTKIRGDVYVYASKGKSADLEAHVFATFGMSPDNYNDWLPRGVIVGTVKIFDCIQMVDDPDTYMWLLGDTTLFDPPLEVPEGVQPQPSIWYPFGKP